MNRTKRPLTLSLMVALVMLAGACGLGSSPEEDRQQLIDDLVASGSVTENDATCIVDAALADYTIDELATLDDDDADPQMVSTMTDLTLKCLTEGDAFEDILEETVEEQGLVGSDPGADGDAATDDSGDGSVTTSATDSVTDSVTDSGTDSATDGFVEVTDATNRLRVTVPDSWADNQSEPSGDGSALTIAPSIDTYLTSWAVDGMKFSVTNASSPVDWRGPMATTNAASECTLASSEDYSDSLYTGVIERYESCGGENTAVVIGATDENETIELLVEVQFDTVDTGDDAAILQKILDTFQAA